MLNLLLGAIGADNVGVFQLTHQVGFDRVNVDSSQFVALGQLLSGQGGEEVIELNEHFVADWK